MSLLTKIFIILVVILNLAYFSFIGSLFSFRVHYKNKLQDKEKELVTKTDEGKQAITALQGQIKSAQLETASLEASRENVDTVLKELNEEMKRVEELSTDLKQREDDLKANNRKITEEHQHLVRLNTDLKTQIDNFRVKQQQLETDKDRVQEEMQKVSAELAQATKNLKLLENRYTELSKDYLTVEEQLKWYSSQVLEVKPIGPAKLLKGKILAVSPESKSICVISIKEIDGVAVGDELAVHRGNSYVGKIRVESVYKDYSMALIIPQLMKDEIKVGDDIISSEY